MTPEPSDPSVVSVEVPLYGVALPPIGGIILMVLPIIRGRHRGEMGASPPSRPLTSDGRTTAGCQGLGPPAW